MSGGITENMWNSEENSSKSWGAVKSVLGLIVGPLNITT